MAKKQDSVRCLCSELVTVRWQDAFGRRHEVVANLGEIWEEGAVLESEVPVRSDTLVRIESHAVELEGRVARCAADFMGYRIEVAFPEECRWSRERYEPQHFLDPRDLEKRDHLKRKNHRLLDECVRHLPLHVT